MCPTSPVPDHCRELAISDPKHIRLNVTMSTMRFVICLILRQAWLRRRKLSFDKKKELLFRVGQGKAAIWSWKSHLLRSVNQDSARVEILENLDKSTVLLVQDWAMKFLPRKYREPNRLVWKAWNPLARDSSNVA